MPYFTGNLYSFLPVITLFSLLGFTLYGVFIIFLQLKVFTFCCRWRFFLSGSEYVLHDFIHLLGNQSYSLQKFIWSWTTMSPISTSRNRCLGWPYDYTNQRYSRYWAQFSVFWQRGTPVTSVAKFTHSLHTDMLEAENSCRFQFVTDTAIFEIFWLLFTSRFPPVYLLQYYDLRVIMI